MTCSHPSARIVPVPVVRELLRALGVETCPRCHQVIRVLGRRGYVVERAP